MTFTVVSWNINSLVPRLKVVTRLLDEESPDVLCLQKCKVAKESFPVRAFTERGYTHHEIRDQDDVNGVAIFSKRPISEVESKNFTGAAEARHLFARLENGVGIHNMYFPAGGSQPDARIDPGFQEKLDFLDNVCGYFDAQKPQKSVLVGDLNIAPTKDDVYDHALLRSQVTHSAQEGEILEKVQKSGAWVDVMRKTQPEGALYSWWAYRWWDANAPVGDKKDRGRRLDHIWATPDLADQLDTSWVHRPARDWKGTSDHAPVFARFNL
ncbi:exodeoxyribonuclease III [Ponticoccus litoralis]|uniref:Exodeoxyribonuclease III n=1 Tax=Ponticoccus litoralis TaxID=422297 RepID=A0AAW9SVL4_9RHOB